MCGIPKISLEGSTADWNKLKEKVDTLSRLNENNRLNWLKFLVPITNNIVDTADSKNVDISFWKNFAKIDGGSRGHFF